MKSSKIRVLVELTCQRIINAVNRVDIERVCCSQGNDGQIGRPPVTSEGWTGGSAWRTSRWVVPELS